MNYALLGKQVRADGSNTSSGEVKKAAVKTKISQKSSMIC